MSFDAQLKQKCPHLIVGDLVYLEEDRVSLYPTMPITASQVTLKVSGNDTDDIFFLARQGSDIFLRFQTPRKALDDFFELSYYTDVQHCKRCQGSKEENDVRYGTFGDIVETRGTQKLVQDIEKILLTVKRSNPFHLWYGTSIASLIGTKSRGFLSSSQITLEIRQALDQYMSIQRQQSAMQTVTPSERLGSILSIQVSQSEIDSTLFSVDLLVTDQRGVGLNITI